MDDPSQREKEEKQERFSPIKLMGIAEQIPWLSQQIVIAAGKKRFNLTT